MDRKDMIRHPGRWLDSSEQPKSKASIWCTFENRSLILVQHDLGFEQGQFIERDLPNQTVERYRIEDKEFEGRRSSSDWDCWKLHVSKLNSIGLPERNRESSQHPQVFISHSQNVQIGNGNAITIQDSLLKLQAAIEKSDASQVEKEEAKGLIHKLTHNPLVCAILGGVASGVGAAASS